MINPSNRAAKLATLCKAQGFSELTEILVASMADNICPAICMTVGCDHVKHHESDQGKSYCDACGGNTVVSALVESPNALGELDTGCKEYAFTNGP